MDKKRDNNDKNKYYLMIDAENILRCSFEIKREFLMNDYNVYYQKGNESITNIFMHYGIPKEYQRVILEFNDKSGSYFPKTKEAEELLTKIPFKLSTITNSENEDTIIYGVTKSNLLEKAMSFSAKATFLPYGEVLQFLIELNQLDLLDSYFRAVLTFFRKYKDFQENSKVLKISPKK